MPASRPGARPPLPMRTAGDGDSRSSIDPSPDADVVDQQLGRKARGVVRRSGPFPADGKIDQHVHRLVRDVIGVLVSPAFDPVEIPNDTVRLPIGGEDVPAGAEIADRGVRSLPALAASSAIVKIGVENSRLL